MTKLSTILLGASLAALLVPGGTGSAQPQRPLYLAERMTTTPLVFRVGDRWTYRNYQIASGGLNRTWTETITHLTGDGFMMSRVDTFGRRSVVITQAPQRVFLGKYHYNYPLFIGKRWTDKIIENGMITGEIDFNVIGQETIKTDAGKFETLVVQSRAKKSSDPVDALSWYAPSAKNVVRFYFMKNGKPIQGTDLIKFRLKRQK